MRRLFTAFFLLLVSLTLPLASVPAASESGVIAITDASIFDGTGAPPHIGTVLIRGGRIAAVGSDLRLPPGTRIINAKGKALLPGFFDVHTHWAPGETSIPQIASAYVQAGITSVNDFHAQPEAFAPRRAWLAQLVAPHVSFAARISTPGGHGADWGDQATTIWINTPEAARQAIRSLEPYKPDLIKAFTDGWRYGMAPDNTSMDEWTLGALAQEAHKHGWPVLTHTVTVDRGMVAARAGVDSLAHGLQDRLLTPDEVFSIRKSGLAMAATLSVYDPYKVKNPDIDPNDPRLLQAQRKFATALQNVKTLHEAGVPIAVGTDAGMPGTPHGTSTLHEIELLVKAGLTPSQALVAATRTSATIMRVDQDRGTITPGKRADLLLIDGRPWENITDIQKIHQVYIDGRLVSGANAPALPPENRADRLPSVTVPALIDDFERADRRSALDTLRLETADSGMDRSVEITQVVPRDEGGKALSLAARMAVKENAYAGVAIPLTRGSVTPVKLDGYHGIRLELKGEGPFSVRLNGLGGSWEAKVTGSTQWSSIELPFSSFSAMTFPGRSPLAWTGDGLVQVEIGGSRPAGERMWFMIDNVRFY